MKRILFAVACTGLAAVGLAGCASPDPTFYTLQPVPGATLPVAPTSIEIRRPGLAGYLDRSDIVLKNAAYKLDVNSQFRWGEPLGDMIARVLAQDLSQRLPGASVFTESGAITAEPQLRLEVDVLAFDPDGSGTVVLTAEVALERGTTHQPVTTRHLALSAPIGAVQAGSAPSGSGAASLVGAMSSLLGQAADRIAQDVSAARLGS